jgi:hypothetical protein
MMEKWRLLFSSMPYSSSYTKYLSTVSYSDNKASVGQHAKLATRYDSPVPDRLIRAWATRMHTLEAGPADIPYWCGSENKMADFASRSWHLDDEAFLHTFSHNSCTLFLTNFLSLSSSDPGSLFTCQQKPSQRMSRYCCRNPSISKPGVHGLDQLEEFLRGLPPVPFPVPRTVCLLGTTAPVLGLCSMLAGRPIPQ